MGEAKRRGSFEDRKKQAIAAGRIKRIFRRELIFKKFKLEEEKENGVK